MCIRDRYGALAAAMIAQGLGLPGPTPQAIVAAQHKAHPPQLLKDIASEANMAFQVLPVPSGLLLTASMVLAPLSPLHLIPVPAGYSIRAPLCTPQDHATRHTGSGSRISAASSL